MTPNFDLIARPYRWLEYLALGSLLARTRNYHLGALADRRHALILGDGDGRFTARLLAAYPEMRADAVDGSAVMLDLLRRRSPQDRVTIHQADVRRFTPTFAPDLVVTHFLLDCLTQAEVGELVHRLVPLLAPDALWLVSDFRVPPGVLGWPAGLYVRALYLAFRLLTGLRVTRLPDFAKALREAGLRPVSIERRGCGLLSTEVWSRIDSQNGIEAK